MAQVISIKKQLKAPSTPAATDELWQKIDRLFLPWLRSAERLRRVDNEHISKTKNAVQLRDSTNSSEILDDPFAFGPSGLGDRLIADDNEGTVEKELSTAAWLFQGSFMC